MHVVIYNVIGSGTSKKIGGTTVGKRGNMVGKRPLHSGAAVISALKRVGTSVGETPVENWHYLTSGVDRPDISEIAY